MMLWKRFYEIFKFVFLHFINNKDHRSYFNAVTFRRYLNSKKQYYEIHKDQGHYN